jgi:hypothetical protein
MRPLGEQGDAALPWLGSHQVFCQQQSTGLLDGLV